MKKLNLFGLVIFTSIGWFSLLHGQETATTPSPAKIQEAAWLEAIRSDSEKLSAAFNAGNAEAVAKFFLPQAELIDERGTIYQGEKEIRGVLSALFEEFPGVRLKVNRESIRTAGPVVIEEGTRTLAAEDGKNSALFRYIAVWAKSDTSWKLASHREFAADPAPTANDYLQSIAWLEGSWINEGADGTVAIQFQWSEDQNYLLGEFTMTDASGATRKSSQRIGWDAKAGHIRSWLFDADGGFSDGVWTVLEDEVVVKSASVNPSGSSASATLTLKQVDKDHFTFSGAERIVGGNREPDFELTITRSPKSASK